MPNPYEPPRTEPVPEREPEAHPVAGPPRAPPTIAEGEEFVSVYSTDDVTLAEMLDEMLQAEGIATPNFGRSTGAHTGLGLMKAEQIIRVPASKRAAARELIDAFLAGSPNELDEVENDLPPAKAAAGAQSILPYVVGGAILLAVLRVCAGT